MPAASAPTLRRVEPLRLNLTVGMALSVDHADKDKAEESCHALLGRLAAQGVRFELQDDEDELLTIVLPYLVNDPKIITEEVGEVYEDFLDRLAMAARTTGLTVKVQRFIITWRNEEAP